MGNGPWRGLLHWGRGVGWGMARCNTTVEGNFCRSHGCSGQEGEGEGLGW